MVDEQILCVRADDYAYGIWFKVIELGGGKVIIHDHILDKEMTFNVDDSQQFKYMSEFSLDGQNRWDRV